MRYFIAGFLLTFCSLIVMDNKFQKEGIKEKNDV